MPSRADLGQVPQRLGARCTQGGGDRSVASHAEVTDRALRQVVHLLLELVEHGRDGRVGVCRDGSSPYRSPRGTGHIRGPTGSCFSRTTRGADRRRSLAPKLELLPASRSPASQGVYRPGPLRQAPAIHHAGRRRKNRLVPLRPDLRRGGRRAFQPFPLRRLVRRRGCLRCLYRRFAWCIRVGRRRIG